ncbi:MAG: ABC-2 family transporter protein [Bacillota bacterium]|nr:ABC-2 family transporter protein [Bacillota bacterium]
MIRAYLEIAKKAFQNNIVYRVDYFAGVINTLVMIFVNIAIWKAIYEADDNLGGVQLKVVMTYIALAFLMQCIFVMEDYFIESKVTSGLISSDLLKPISFRAYVFSYNVGSSVFRVLMQLLPTLVISIFLFKLLPPFSTEMGILFFFSAVLGYLVLYCLNFIVWMSSFWFYYTFSLVTIKDALVMVLSGALIPLWFLPQWLFNFVKLTPFESIFFTPISIYLGQVPAADIKTAIIKQVAWIVVLALAGHLLWNAAKHKLVLQGG